MKTNYKEYKPQQETMLSVLKFFYNIIFNQTLIDRLEDAMNIIKKWCSLDDLRKEYEEQDNRITAYPIYVTVQSLHCIGVLDDDYGLNIDGVVKTEYTHSECEESYLDYKEICAAIKEIYPVEDEYEWQKEKINKLKVGYAYIDEEVFLTVKGAEDYIARNRHNLRDPRTYVKHFSYRNFEMRTLIETIGFKSHG